MCEPMCYGHELSLFQSGYAALLASALLARHRAHVDFVRRSPAERQRPTVLGVFRPPSLGPRAVRSLSLFLCVLVGLAAANVWPLVTLLLAAPASLLYFAQVIDVPDVRRKTGTVPVILLLIGLSSLPAVAAHERVAALVLLTIKILVAQVYLSAGLNKLRVAGWRWADGRTLRSWLAHYAVRRPPTTSLGRWPLPSLGSCRVASAMVLIFELTFWIIIAVPSLTWWFVSAAVMLHLGTAVMMGIHYWLFFGPALLVFLTPVIVTWLA